MSSAALAHITIRAIGTLEGLLVDTKIENLELSEEIEDFVSSER